MREPSSLINKHYLSSSLQSQIPVTRHTRLVFTPVQHPSHESDDGVCHTSQRARTLYQKGILHFLASFFSPPLKSIYRQTISSSLLAPAYFWTYTTQRRTAVMMKHIYRFSLWTSSFYIADEDNEWLAICRNNGGNNTRKALGIAEMRSLDDCVPMV